MIVNAALAFNNTCGETKNKVKFLAVYSVNRVRQFRVNKLPLGQLNVEVDRLINLEAFVTQLSGNVTWPKDGQTLHVVSATDKNGQGRNICDRTFCSRICLITKLLRHKLSSLKRLVKETDCFAVLSPMCRVAKLYCSRVGPTKSFEKGGS